MSRQAFEEQLVSDTIGVPYEKAELRERANQVKGKFMHDVFVLKKPTTTLYGVFGEVEGCDGYQEEIIEPKEGGTFLKIYGCSYLFKSNVKGEVVKGLQMAKFLVSGLPERLIGRSFIYASAVAFKFIFFRKRFIRDLEVLFEEIDWKVVRHYDFPRERYNKFTKEIRCALEDSLNHKYYWDQVIAKAINFICLFLEIDNAYRFRVQDAFAHLNKNFKDGTKELFRLLDIMMSRETEIGITSKWKFMKLALKGAFLFSSRLRRITSNFLRNIDVERIKMDEADLYFSKLFKSYNFEGKTFDQRAKEWKQINDEKLHVFLI